MKKERKTFEEVLKDMGGEKGIRVCIKAGNSLPLKLVLEAARKEIRGLRKDKMVYEDYSPEEIEQMAVDADKGVEESQVILQGIAVASGIEEKQILDCLTWVEVGELIKGGM